MSMRRTAPLSAERRVTGLQLSVIDHARLVLDAEESPAPVNLFELAPDGVPLLQHAIAVDLVVRMLANEGDPDPLGVNEHLHERLENGVLERLQSEPSITAASLLRQQRVVATATGSPLFVQRKDMTAFAEDSPGEPPPPPEPFRRFFVAGEAIRDQHLMGDVTEVLLEELQLVRRGDGWPKPSENAD